MSETDNGPNDMPEVLKNFLSLSGADKVITDAQVHADDPMRVWPDAQSVQDPAWTSSTEMARLIRAADHILQTNNGDIASAKKVLEQSQQAMNKNPNLARRIAYQLASDTLETVAEVQLLAKKEGKPISISSPSERLSSFLDTALGSLASRAGQTDSSEEEKQMADAIAERKKEWEGF